MAVEIAVAVGELAPVEIKPYDRVWSERFAVCAELVRAALGGYAVRVDHIGSTAVPGLLGRPHLDIQVSVAEPEAEEEYRAALEDLGFALWVREADRRVFVAPQGALSVRAPKCEVHIYVCRSGGVLEYDQLLLVQYLASHPERRDQYADLKRRLARQCRNDPEAYAEGKRAFLRETVRMAHRAYLDLRALPDVC
ncbi:GrpB family protein [Actinocrinis puniceicyclus]|uniref:GrpB family protein n=1 Tax=Actinocrinis puniceicyclus TaxID=977794 RepID=A0A8J8BD12_9ACTN|nr:GrpB family protein [Actinocrinis puniceicyclus]MBS2963636.1 GrpB family protein [Actinocrinis puniceicyclus]